MVRYLGIISYPMYLYHQWGDSVGRAVTGKFPVFAVGLLATIGLATGSCYVIEKPFLSLRRSFAADRSTTVATVPTAAEQVAT